MKSWDPIVFGKPVSKSIKGPSATSAENPKLILMLAGPPGVGKTSLAHIAANKAGYQPVEVNASDDRTAVKLEQQIESVCATNALSSSGRPLMLIIDEVDGVADMGGSSGKDPIVAIARFADRKTRAGDAFIKRPIICICNEGWNRNLRPLRDRSHFINIRPLPGPKLVERLRSVCEKQSVPTEPIALQQLTSTLGYDVRACLNTLQFMSRRNKKTKITLDALKKLDYTACGFKDRKQTEMDLLTKTFKPRIARHKGDRNADTLLVEAHTYGAAADFQRLATVFEENFLNVQFSDPQMKITSKIIEQLAWADVLDASLWRSPMHTSPSYAVLLPILTAARNCSTQQQPKLQLTPFSEIMHRQMLAQRERVLRALQEKCSLAVLSSRSRSFVWQTVPFMSLCFLPYSHFSWLRESAGGAAKAFKRKQNDAASGPVDVFWRVVELMATMGVTWVIDDEKTVMKEKLARLEKANEDEDNQGGSVIFNQQNEVTEVFRFEPEISLLSTFEHRTARKAKSFKKREDAEAMLPLYHLDNKYRQIIGHQVNMLRTEGPLRHQIRHSVGDGIIKGTTRGGDKDFLKQDNAVSTVSKGVSSLSSWVKKSNPKKLSTMMEIFDAPTTEASTPPADRCIDISDREMPPEDPHDVNDLAALNNYWKKRKIVPSGICMFEFSEGYTNAVRRPLMFQEVVSLFSTMKQ
eukprot:GHVL01033338.1.p1 GENE.GHVL01033338.1~~GHVL01033338.1.p1  ORF type:complete len:694 (+),score=124.99 GHVL01033338.1:617-2698(+)